MDTSKSYSIKRLDTVCLTLDSASKHSTTQASHYTVSDSLTILSQYTFEIIISENLANIANIYIRLPVNFSTCLLQ